MTDIDNKLIDRKKLLDDDFKELDESIDKLRKKMQDWKEIRNNEN